MADLNRQWTKFALEAEYDGFGMNRIVNAHNKLRAELEELKRGEFICRKCGLRKDSEHEHAEF